LVKNKREKEKESKNIIFLMHYIPVKLKGSKTDRNGWDGVYFILIQFHSIIF